MRNVLASVAILSACVVMAAATPAAPQSAPAGTGATHPAGSPIADGAAPVRLAANFAWTEGSTSDKDGNVYFVDQAQNVQKILIWEFDKASDDPLKGRLVTFLNPSGYSNGMSFDADGNLIDCADEKNELWEIHAPFPKHAEDPNQAFKPADLKIDVIIKNIDPTGKKVNPEAGGKLMNGPNDVWIIPAGPQKGGMYLGDPLYSRTWWGAVRPANDRQTQVGGRYVWFLSPDRKTITPVVTDFQMPNGFIGTADAKTLYVSDITARKTYSYTINDDGTLGNKKPFCDAGSDGMTIDSDGNVYTTSGNARTGVSIFNKEGKLVDTIPISSGNCCFGGKDGNILFICGNKEIYGVKMKTHRVGPA
ncbi:MAG TPA: SMP-30/gluconolactonase/LRE family protein [Phycisphaerae bacterium]|jgi:gluconolactonase|nr:SMP-30/gluconolactonase/LRE family protein [Phycisphaerae bacterium]